MVVRELTIGGGRNLYSDVIVRFSQSVTADPKTRSIQSWLRRTGA